MKLAAIKSMSDVDSKKKMTSKPNDANETCVGPSSEQAGKVDSCAGCPNQKICASGPKGPDPAIAEIAAKLSFV